MKKKKLLDKLWLKYTDRAAYKEYKWLLATYKEAEFKRFLMENMRLSNFNQIQEFANEHKVLNFNHSGNSGDIIYALPTIQQIQERIGVDINLYFRIDQPSNLAR